MTRQYAAAARVFGRFAPRPGRHVVASADRAPVRFAAPADFHDGLSAGQRGVMVGAVLAAHVVGGWALLQIREVREAVAEAAPMFVGLVAPPAPPEPVRIEPPSPPPKPVVRQPPKPVVVAARPSPAPAPFIVQTPPPEPPAAEPAPSPMAVAPPLAPPALPAPPAPPPAPKIIPASAVQYLEPIVLQYPRLSQRNGETGRVLIRVYIDEAGLAKNVQVHRSSGHPRLDDAALAAVQKARFKPYTENGAAVAGWAYIPLDFELEK
jgi:protein TonB